MAEQREEEMVGVLPNRVRHVYTPRELSHNWPGACDSEAFIGPAPDGYLFNFCDRTIVKVNSTLELSKMQKR